MCTVPSLILEYRKIKRPFPPMVYVHPVAYPAPPEALPAVLPSARPARPPGRPPTARRPLRAPQAPGRAEKTGPNVWGWRLQRAVVSSLLRSQPALSDGRGSAWRSCVGEPEVLSHRRVEEIGVLAHQRKQ